MKSQETIKKTRLGDILLEKRLITNDQLQFAINAQKTSQLPLGEILIAHKCISRRQINRALQTQSKLRNAILSSILSLSPLALVGCGSAGDAPPESNTSVEQVLDASQINSDNSTISSSSITSNNDTSSDAQEVVVNQPSSSLPTGDQTSSSEAEATSETTEATPVTTEDPDALGAIQLSWMYPEKRTDGSDFYVHEVQSFKIYQLSEEGGVDNVYEVSGFDTDFTVENLEKGNYFFAITVVDVDGLESDFSEAISVPLT